MFLILSKRNIKNNKGQSLIELVVAISIILIGVVSTLVLTVSTIRGGRASEMQTIATNLAREGVEVVKQHRYNNWLRIESNDLSFLDWDEGLPSEFDGNNLRVEFDPALLTWNLDYGIDSVTSQACSQNGNCLLYLNNGVYSHIPVGVVTPFYRMVTVNPICKRSDGFEYFKSGTYICNVDDKKVGLQIISEVRWQERNNWDSVIFEDHIYNWK